MTALTVSAWPTPFKSEFHTDTYSAIDPTSPRLSTTDKHILITGGGSGIGPEIARSFAMSGAAAISLVGRTEKTLLETKARLEKYYPGTKIFTFVADIVDKDALASAFNASTAAAGPIDVLVVNAGVLTDLLPLASSNALDWDTSIDVNIKGSYNTIQAFLPNAAKKGAAVIHVSTGINSLQFVPGYSAYHISKLAGAKIFEYLHHEHPELFVLNMHPGVQKTAMEEKTKAVGIEFPHDSIRLPSDFIVWAVSQEAKPFNGKFLWCHWDVEDLIARKNEIVGTTNLEFGLLGWPVLL